MTLFGDKNVYLKNVTTLLTKKLIYTSIKKFNLLIKTNKSLFMFSS